MDILKNKIFNTKTFDSILNKQEQNLFITGASGSLDSFIVSHLFEKLFNKIIITSADSSKLFKLRDDLNFIIGKENSFKTEIYLSKCEEEFETEISSLSSILKKLFSNDSYVILVDPATLIAKTAEEENFNKLTIKLKKGEEYSFDSLVQQLKNLGFNKKRMVEEENDFAVRGGIIDIFPEYLDQPVRIEFFSNAIESIREFDISTQRSISQINSVEILPANLKSDNGIELYKQLNENSLVILYEPDIIESEYPGVFDYLRKYRRAFFSVFSVAKSASLTLADNIKEIHLISKSQPAFNSNIKLLYKNLLEMKNNGYDIYLTATDDYQSDRFRELITDLDLNNELEGIAYLNNSPHNGFIMPDDRLALYTEHEVFSRYYRPVKHRRKFHGITFKELVKVSNGDYMVHHNYGIGKYAGLKKIKAAGVVQEAVKLLYKDNDSVYVSLNSLHLIKKYSAQDGHTPKLSKLGGNEWEKIKHRTKKKIQEIARDLILLYAKRKNTEGFRFSKDTVWQKELEASFIYEDTPDQITATVSVKRDMENHPPMDRLICGDVGFGKTEIAVRAAFKAVQDNKQVAILVPTTILAEQHYFTFKDRLEGWAVEVEHLSRFKTKSEQQIILKRLEEGKINIIIGTHRLLSKDINFKSAPGGLGLLIIDEEHRFGVRAKEKLKMIKENVDVLTLTATPIPRTLNFSLLGARDLSIINTPPKNRQPIHTEIINFDKKIIADAITKELQRNGQVYFVNDKIAKLDEYAQMIEELVPSAKVALAHGQMNPASLENVMMKFLEKKYNVLVCTKIIESGLDIPSVNTILINRADNFGLAELYQLRGRVGRSNIKSYAYLITPPQSSLTKQAVRRLHALEEFTELGSGMNLALRDLEIRGAGNLLGREQSGFIAELGFDTYMQILDDAVSELKESEIGAVIPEITPQEKHGIKKLQEITLESDRQMLIPEYYIDDENTRLEIYQKLSKAASEEEINSVHDELLDRFSKLPYEVVSLITHVKLKLELSLSPFNKAIIRGNTAELFFDLKDELFKSGKFENIISYINSNPSQNIKIKQTKKTLSAELEFKDDVLNQTIGFIKVINQI